MSRDLTETLMGALMSFWGLVPRAETRPAPQTPAALSRTPRDEPWLDARYVSVCLALGVMQDGDTDSSDRIVKELELRPHIATIRNRFGDLLIHIAARSLPNTAEAERVMAALIRANPAAVSTPNQYGQLPLHQVASVAVMTMLLEAVLRSVGCRR